jgi:hypothetical protein
VNRLGKSAYDKAQAASAPAPVPQGEMQKPPQPTTTLPPQVSKVPSRKQSLCDQTIKIRSWKGDYLHRPDSESGVTTWNADVGNEWIIECINSNSDSKIMLRSWKGDYLHRPDSESGVITWNAGGGNEWEIIKISNRQIMLKSWKGDYLHRPDTASGVTTWTAGVGDKWVIEILN